MMTRSLNAAKDAYREGDPERSRLAHQGNTEHGEDHSAAGEYVRAMVYGGLDGIISTFAVIAASVGAGLHHGIILIVGFANLVGDALSMGLGDYLSGKAEIQHAFKERELMRSRYRYNPDKEKKALEQVYVDKGFTPDEAKRIVSLLAEDTTCLVDIMLQERYGISVPEEEEGPGKGAFATFLSFMVFGALPVIAFLFGNWNQGNGPDTIFAISCVLTAVSLFSLGALKNKMLGRSWVRGGMFMLVNGTITTVISFFVGLGLQRIN